MLRFEIYVVCVCVLCFASFLRNSINNLIINYQVLANLYGLISMRNLHRYFQQWLHQPNQTRSKLFNMISKDTAADDVVYIFNLSSSAILLLLSYFECVFWRKTNWLLIIFMARFTHWLFYVVTLQYFIIPIFHR